MSVATLGPIFNAQHGKTREWSISISLFDEHGAVIDADGRSAADIDVLGGYYALYTTRSGYSGMKMTVSTPTVVRAGKNLGKKNSTNALTQALKDCESKYRSKIKAGYSATVAAASELLSTLPFPMAVKTWRDHGHKLQYPLFMQPKLDGVRMLAQRVDDGCIRLSTRRLHEITGFDAVRAALKRMFDASDLNSFIIDGELYSHGMNLQTISGLVRNASIPESEKEKLQYHVFDCFDVRQPQLTFAERHDRLRELFAAGTGSTAGVVLTETLSVDSAEQGDTYFTEMVGRGYEGVIYKSVERKYEFSFHKEKRSAWYLKRKTQDDAEYAIVDFTEGKGKDRGCVVFVLQTPAGKRFNSVPNGAYDYRKELYQLAVERFDEVFAGKFAKVQYDDLSKDGVPLRGRIVQIDRDLAFD